MRYSRSATEKEQLAVRKVSSSVRILLKPSGILYIEVVVTVVGIAAAIVSVVVDVLFLMKKFFLAFCIEEKVGLM